MSYLVRDSSDKFSRDKAPMFLAEEEIRCIFDDI